MVFVHEYITGGGWPETELPAGLAAESLAMLGAVLADFLAWGRVRTVTMLDRRLEGVELPADEVIKVGPAPHPQEYLETVGRLAGQGEAALIIAPESDGILARLNSLVERNGARLLGSSPVGVSIAADKWGCYQRFKKAGLPSPETWRVSWGEAEAVARRIGLPLVVKPIDGVGCEGVGLASDNSSLQKALEEVLRGQGEAPPTVVAEGGQGEAPPTACQEGDVLLQRYMAGTHASVSLLVTSQGTVPLSLNEQLVRVGVPFSYQGGVVPLRERPAKERALALAQRAVSLVPGLRGYVGVDLILTEKEGYLIEINPRLTSSYVGLRQVIKVNLAQAMWEACCRDRLPRPEEIVLSGEALFRKEELKVGRLGELKVEGWVG